MPGRKRSPGVPESFGGRLRAAREGEGLSEEALARRLGLDPGTVAAWERDEVSRPYLRIRRIFERWLGLLRRLPPSGETVKDWPPAVGG